MSGHWMSANTDTTELMFASSSHSCTTLSGRYAVLRLGADIVIACSHVRLLDVDIESDLSLDDHCIYAGCYYRLCHLRRMRRSLDSDSLATLVYANVNSLIDYCNTVLAGALRTVTDKLQCVLSAAARFVTGTRTAVWVSYCTMNFIDWTSTTGFSLSWQ